PLHRQGARLMRGRVQGWLFVLAVLVAAGAAGYLTYRNDVIADWGHGGRSSISPESRAVLDSLHGPVEIVSYASPQGDLRKPVSGLVERYRRFKHDLSVRFVDPQQDPAKMRELGITVDGALILHYDRREVRLDELSERSLTNALERLARGGERIVAFV